MSMIWKPAWATAVLVLAATLWPAHAQGPQTSPIEAATPGRTVIETDPHKRDYGLGVQMGRNLKNQGIDADVDLVIQGLRDALAGRKLLLAEDELRRVMMALRTETRQARVRNQAIAADENFKGGEAFLAENKAKPGVVTLPSGLQYKVIKAGNGPKPSDTDSVEVQYRGTLLDGTEFDSSFRNQKPASFIVKASLPGWRQALQLMPVGSKWELVLPPRLAYGPRGTGLGVGPQATVIFELELLAITAQKEASR
jgi:FKBP-type peptidyl-prolyl cis-trans isomerase